MEETIEMIYNIAYQNMVYAKNYYDIGEYALAQSFVYKAHEDIWVIYHMESTVPYMLMINKMPNIFKGEEVTKWWE